jgi:hypothetical protein
MPKKQLALRNLALILAELYEPGEGYQSIGGFNGPGAIDLLRQAGLIQTTEIETIFDRIDPEGFAHE